MRKPVIVAAFSFLFAALAVAQPVPTCNQPATRCATSMNQELTFPGEIVSNKATKMLQGVIELRQETRTFIDFRKAADCPYICTSRVLRAYHGYRGFSLDPKDRVTPTGIAAGGPTLRAAVGDTVQLIFFNRIDPSQFSLTSTTSMSGEDCDTAVNTKGVQTYPPADKNPDGTPAEAFPNCFHASNTANLHFHGTHVSPSGFGDNVLIGVLPNKSLDTAAAFKLFNDTYAKWDDHKDPTNELLEAGETALEAMRKAAFEQKNKVLTAQLDRAMASNLTAKENHEWPQYWPGWFPHQFTLPIASTDPAKFPRMGQAPGTHWYHSHQHGSTSLQVLNGMSGLFIITSDEYDGKILRLGGGTPDAPKIKEKVMLFQMFSDQVNLINNRNNPALNKAVTSTLIEVNGQALPKVTMRKGEVQWWRMANASIRAHGQEQYFFLTKVAWDVLVADPTKLTATTPYPNGGARPADPPVMSDKDVPSFSQTAQDGVQFTWPAYDEGKKKLKFLIPPGGRVDALVKAPETEGEMYLVVWPPAAGKAASGPPPISDIRANTVLRVVVSGDPTDENTSLPTEAQYPVRPPFLDDIPASETNERHRAVVFSMTGAPGTAPISQFYIDNKKFEEGIIDQVMLLGQAEDWTVKNTSLTGITHPFHIHVNPFQVIEIFDPATMDAPEVQKYPVWRDTMQIPAAIGTTAGYIKIRSRFVDFPGKFVLHCHILGHEDRGMMQLIEVVDNKTVVKHH